jgi:hypothetical protein
LAENEIAVWIPAPLRCDRGRARRVPSPVAPFPLQRRVAKIGRPRSSSLRRAIRSLRRACSTASGARRSSLVAALTSPFRYPGPAAQQPRAETSPLSISFWTSSRSASLSRSAAKRRRCAIITATDPTESAKRKRSTLPERPRLSLKSPSPTKTRMAPPGKLGGNGHRRWARCRILERA